MLEFKFNGSGTYTDFGLLLQKGYAIGEPVARTNYVTVPARHGALDLSETLAGEMLFDNREFNSTFILLPPRTDWEKAITKFRNSIHGKNIKVQTPDDKDYYYLGRLFVGTPEQDGSMRSLPVTGILEPYKYKNNLTTITHKLTSATQSITLKNARKKIIPTITVSATTQIIFASVTISLTVGTHKNSNILLNEGNNAVNLKAAVGTTVTFKYQEGDL